MFINITDSETGNNKGSCSALVNYLEKENRQNLNKHKLPEFWFNGKSDSIIPQEVRVRIDNNISKLGRKDAKFYLINISPSQKEIKWLKQQFGEKGTEEKLKAFAIKLMDKYARNFKRPGVESGSDLLWFGKLEHLRYYSYRDSEVKRGARQRGIPKEGEQMHIQIIVSRKDITNKIKLSPMNNSRGSNASHSAKLGQFDRKAFKISGESIFDIMLDFERNLKDSFEYAVTMKKGSLQQKKLLIQLERPHQYENNLQKQIRTKNQELEALINTQYELNSALFSTFLNSENDNSFENYISVPKRKKKKKQ